MKFRYKVLFSNVIILSISLGLVGYLMIQKNFSLAKEGQLGTAVTQNNLIQTAVEYEILEEINSGNSVTDSSLGRIGAHVSENVLLSGTAFFLRYKDKYVYVGDDEAVEKIDSALYEKMSVGDKKYVILENEEKYYAYVTSYSLIDGESFSVVTKTDITDAYHLMRQQVMYFRFLIVGVLLAAAISMYVVATLLTRPLERLNTATEQISEGDYSVNLAVKGNDEVALLARKFNHMAKAIGEHVSKLQEMIHQREQFVADFTHEIKTPMTSIIGYADTIRSVDLTREKELMAANYIYSEGKRLEKLSMHLFDLIYLRNHEISTGTCYTGDLIEELKTIVSPALEAKNQSLSVDVTNEKIECNRELLLTVFVNLVDNARKASPENSVISINGNAQAEEYYDFSVEDFGIGMKEEDVERICDEFYMVDKSRSRKEGGAGIGMSLVAIIMEKHHATLNIESELNKGTKITLCGFRRVKV